MVKTRISLNNLALKDAFRLFEKASDLADTFEDIMEARGGYNPEFSRGLKLSLKQAASGKLKRISSLKDLK